MLYKTLSRESLGNNNWFVEIELIPENDFETNVIRNVEAGESREEEQEVIENYLVSALDGMSLINLVRQKQNVFALTVTST
jgi:hypothetical protein